MIVPVISYGNSVLRKVCRELEPDDPCIESIMTDLIDTMEAADGVGLAAPQINKSVKMFMVDTRQIYDRMNEENRAAYFPEGKGVRDIFINARITKESADTFLDQEGCLSIPTVHEEIERSWSVQIEYLNIEFKKQTREFSGYTARAIQHEIDHTQGILFIDHLAPLKKKLLRSKLKQISEGQILIKYSMQFTW